MERKYKSQKKTIIALAIIIVLFIALICFLQVRIKNVKADIMADMDVKVAELTAQRDELQAAFDEQGLEEKADELKDQSKALEKEKKALLKALKEAAEEEPADETDEG